jgi:SAM-dependent methyltransferase
MVAVARGKAEDRPGVRFFHASFEQLGNRGREYDAVVVLGNSLSAAGTEEAVRVSLSGLARSVAPGGLLVLHLLNYPALIRSSGGLRPLRRVVHEGVEHLFLKLFEVHAESVVLDIVHLVRERGEYRQALHRTTLRPLTLPRLREALEAEGLVAERALGGFHGGEYDEERSGDLIVVARSRAGSES